MTHFFLFYTTIYPKLNNNNLMVRTNNINQLLNLSNEIVKELKFISNTNIWDICNKYSKISLDILNSDNSYKDYYHIHHLFNWLERENYLQFLLLI